MTTRIIGTGSALPETIVTNDDLAKVVDTNDEWIASRTGIHARHIAKAETTTSLAIEAGIQALENSGLQADTLDLIIVATCSPDSFFPSTACQVQRALQANHAAAFDLSAACTGFLVALHTAHAYISSGIYETALIIGAETLSRLVDWEDRGTCVLFGDGAGAVVVQKDERGLLAMVQYADGAKGEVLTCENTGIDNLLVHPQSRNPSIVMQGQEVFKFAVRKVPEAILQVLEKSQVQIEEITYFVLHQANSRIIQSVAKRLQVSEDKFPMNLDRKGNTSAASIPILLHEMCEEKLLLHGDKIIISGFGGGLTWGAALIEW